MATIITPDFIKKIKSKYTKPDKEPEVVYTDEISRFFPTTDEMIIFFQGYFNIFENRMFSTNEGLSSLYGNDISLRAFKNACIKANDGLIDIMYVPDSNLVCECLDELKEKVAK